MQEELMNKELGLDLLMNPKKKATDAMSVISSQSLQSSRGAKGHEEDRYSDIMSVKSVSVKPEIVDVMNHMDQSVMNEDFDESASYNSSSISSYVSNRKHKNKKNVSNVSDTESALSLNPSTCTGTASVQSKIRVKAKSMTDEEVLNAKKEILYQFDRLEKKGYKLPRKFTMASSLNDMKQEYDRIIRDKSIDNSIKFQRQTMITIVSGIELLNNYFDPIGAKLSGWSESINENIDDYDDIFEELHTKYKGKAKIAPELKLLFMLGGSAFMFHMTNCLFKSSSMPGLDQVLKQNPELAKQFAAATANTMAQNNASPMMSGLGGMFSSMFGGGGGDGGGGLMSGIASMFGGGNMRPPQPPPAQATASSEPVNKPMRSMRGPTNVDDFLKEMDGADNDRIEVFSNVSESDITDFADDASINNLLMNKKKGGRRKKMTLDI